MNNAHRFISFKAEGDIYHVQLRYLRMDEGDVHEMADELLALIQDHGCRFLALALGPKPLDCLYSVFLAKLVTLQRSLQKHDGRLALCYLSPEVKSIFTACKLENQFHFADNFESADSYFAATLVSN